MNKKILLLIIGSFFLTNLFSQPLEQFECSDNIRKNARAGVDQNLLQQRKNELGLRASFPYTMKIQVIVFYKNLPTVNDASILRNITNMVNFYRPHNICFVLSDIEYIKDSAMADFNTDNEDLLLSYTRPSYITIFIHTDLKDGTKPIGGKAYAIPNNYLSVLDETILDYSNISTLAHEMGHCFGLYHTFERIFGKENVPRTGTCKNCETKGDFLCDTEADLELYINSHPITYECVYDGEPITSSCDNSPYLLELRNIMSYGRFSCRNHFSNGQGARARDHILTDIKLYNCIAPDILTISTIFNQSGGIFSLTSKDLINVASPSYNISGSAQMRMTSKSIRLGPGVSFKPTGNAAIVSLKINTNCN